MRPGVPFFVASLLVVFHACIACSENKGHEEFANGNCTIPPCSSDNAVGNGGPQGSGGAGGEAGVDAASSTGLNCTTDPTSQLTLCAATTLCPAFRLDVVSFPGCGFLESQLGIDLECVCNGTLLCPIGVQTSCTTIRSLVAQRTVTDICNQVVNGTCRDLGGVPAAGQGGASSTCDRNCAATCPPNSPSCITSCGC
jgi:hypothetical protein